MNYARQRDRNEPEIVQALEDVGAAVQRLGEAGVPDLLVSFRGEMWLLEVKNPEAKGGARYNTGGSALTSTQAKWWARWRGKQPVIVQTVDEALAAIGAVTT
jgi:hypothetical protein